MASKRRPYYETSSPDDDSNLMQLTKRVKPEQIFQDDPEEDPEEDLIPQEAIQLSKDHKPLVSGADRIESGDPDESVRKIDMSFRSGVMKRGMSRRFWNEEDEIIVLKGLIGFNQNKTGDSGTFYDCIKNSMNSFVSRKQLHTKFKVLKRKFRKNIDKSEEEKNLIFSANSHEKELFELSEKLWGGNYNNNVSDFRVVKEDEEDGYGIGICNNSAEQEKAEEEAKEDEDVGEGDYQYGIGIINNYSAEQEKVEEDKEDNFWSRYPCLNESMKMEQFSEFTLSNFVKQRMCCIGSSKAKVLEEKWRKLQVAETQVKLLKAQLIQEQTEMILDAIR
ncbi:STOREKEEPER protein-like [Mercurialis annua]|uniref:STOREKEEPER protein-like n=1 Tax=Mercurialis annua TaxID=3986 RepID=UPI00215E17CD|nr:STOREKEEPER protein-like [Mercurialis annua]